MKASEAYRIIADMAERTGSENLTENLIATFISHLAIDCGRTKKQIVAVVEKAFDLMEPGFEAMRAATAGMKPEDMTNLDALEKVSNEGLGAVLEASQQGKVKS